MFRTVWSALALVGAGLILFALASGLALPLAILLSSFALSQLGFGAVTLRIGRIPAPKVLLGVCGAVTVIDVVLVFVGLIGFVPFVALLLFEWGIAITAALQLRRSVDEVPRPGTGRLLAALATGAIVVAAITTPALSLTEPGSAALPHGVHHHDH